MWEDEVREEIKRFGIDTMTSKDFAIIADRLGVDVVAVVRIHADMLKERRDTALPADRPKTKNDKMFKK